MWRILGGLLAGVLTCGCMSRFSTGLVVRSPSPEPVGAPAPADIAAAAAFRPAVAGDRWVAYTAGEEQTAVEREAVRKRLCLCRARRKSNLLWAGVPLGMVAYGVIFFGHGDSDFTLDDDGGFGEGTKDGGADKPGHALSTHIQTAIFSALNRRAGIPRKEAALRGALTAWTVQFVMEVGDGYAEQFDASWTDLLANTAGATFGYFQEVSPRFDQLLDFRWEYWPTDRVTSGENLEPSTDFDGSAYVLALNTGAVVSPRRRTPLDFLDLQAGYYSRDYRDHDAPTQRVVFVGVGLNLSNICRRMRLRALATLFEYYQPPGISLRIKEDLND